MSHDRFQAAQDLWQYAYDLDTGTKPTKGELRERFNSVGSLDLEMIWEQGIVALEAVQKAIKMNPNGALVTLVQAVRLSVQQPDNAQEQIVNVFDRYDEQHAQS